MFTIGERMPHGSLEPLSWSVYGDAACRVWCGDYETDSGEVRKGFLTVNGGLSPDPSHARVFRGPGEAIRVAQIHGIAITDGIKP